MHFTYDLTVFVLDKMSFYVIFIYVVVSEYTI